MKKIILFKAKKYCRDCEYKNDCKEYNNKTEEQKNKLWTSCGIREQKLKGINQ